MIPPEDRFAIRGEQGRFAKLHYVGNLLELPFQLRGFGVERPGRDVRPFLDVDHINFSAENPIFDGWYANDMDFG